MVIKDRSEPLELMYLRSLNVRSQMSEKDKMNYLYAERGSKGN